MAFWNATEQSVRGDGQGGGRRKPERAANQSRHTRFVYLQQAHAGPLQQQQPPPTRRACLAVAHSAKVQHVEGLDGCEVRDLLVVGCWEKCGGRNT